MRTKNPIVLIAVGATFALADHEMSSQATDSDNATALVPADTWPSSPIAGAIQPDKARPRRIVDTTAATTTEERVPKGMGWKAELSTFAQKSAALSKFLKVKNPWSADHFIQKTPELSEMDQEKLKRYIDVIMPYTMGFDGILTQLRQKISITAPMADFSRIYIEDKTAKLYADFFKTIRKCARQGDSQKMAIHRAHKSAIPRNYFTSGDETYIKLYYDEQIKEMENEVEGYVKQGYSLQQVIAHINHEYNQQVSTHIGKIYRKLGADTLLGELRPQVELQLEKGATSDQVHAGLNPDGSDEKSNIIESCITQWKKNREANIYKMLREWVVMGKSEGEIYQLLQNRGISETLNTQDLITFGSMSKNPRDHIQMQYVEWYRDGVSPMEASAKLGGISGGRESEAAKFIEEYIEEYGKAEKEIKEWLQDKKMNPDELSKELRLKRIRKDSPENLWKKAKYATYKQRWEDSLKT